MKLYFSKPLRLFNVVYFIVCDSSFLLLCSFLSFFQVVVHYACDCSCTLKLPYFLRKSKGLGNNIEMSHAL